MADDPNEIPWLPDEFSNHPLTEEETKEYELAICFERDVLGYPLPPGTLLSPPSRASPIASFKIVYSPSSREGVAAGAGSSSAMTVF